MSDDREQRAFAWQVGVWDRMSEVYQREIDRRFAPVVEREIVLAALQPGEQVLDLGAGTGAIAERAAPLVAPDGDVTAVDISREMLVQAAARLSSLGLRNVRLLEGRAEAIPVDDGAFDVVIASLSLMYAIDRAASAHEIARVLRPGGRFIAAVWGGPEECDLIKFQQIAGSFAPTPPVPGIGPGAMAEPAPFIAQLAEAGIAADAEDVRSDFDFASSRDAWDVSAAVTANQLDAGRQEAAKAAVQAALYPQGDGPRRFRNVGRIIAGGRIPALKLPG